MKQKHVSLSDKTTEIILGSLLGDGSLKIHPKYKNARFSFRHSEMQKAYFYWKVEQLSEIAGGKSVFIQKADGYSKNQKLRFQSPALEPLTDLYKLTHKNGKFAIRRKWLNMMTPLSLAIWWFDDGSVIGTGRKGAICTEGFNKELQQILVKYLRVVWKVNVRINKIGPKRDGKKNEYYRIFFTSAEELKKFLRIILPYIPKGIMLSKVTLLYKDTNLQQRWISEVSSLSGISIKEVEHAVKIKKSKWKNFRE